MSESLSSLLTKERPGAICSGHSCQKIYRERIALNFVFKKTSQWFVHDSSESLEKSCQRFAWKKRIFVYIKRIKTYSMYTIDSISQISHFFLPKSESLLSLFAQSLFLKSNRSDLLSSLFTKKQQWANRSRCSLQKSNCERITLSKSKSLFRSFAHKKQATPSKNQRTNSQPCNHLHKLHLN